MSIHFAPRWLKPIKPTGTSPTPTSDNSPVPIKPVNTLANTPNVPFPALSQGQFSASPVSSTGAREHVLSYSRATHTTMSPNTSADGSYFSNGETNGKVDPNHHPFRYSREQILALWDEDKVKETPIELVEMLDVGDVLVSKSVERPVGLGELSEVEKKVCQLSTFPLQCFARSQEQQD